MEYIVRESNENNIGGYIDGIISINIEDYNLMIKYDNEELIKYLIKNDELINFMRASEEFIEFAINYVINDKDDKDLMTAVSKERMPLFSLATGKLKKIKNDYQRLINIKNAKKVTIECNKDNLIKGLELAKKINAKTIINCPNISLHEYKGIFDNYNIEELKNYDIKINYQENNSPIKPLELYSLSYKVCSIVDEVKKYNLSKLEQIMYVYDIVKNRIYRDDKDNGYNSRDLDKVIDGEYIVCCGYSNLFNAILKCLDIDAMPILSYQKKHQRSIAYVKDEKYNIDGIYAFDPTMDRRRSNDDNSYIDNYQGFMIPYFKSHIEFPDDRFSIFDISLEDIIKVVNNCNYDTNINLHIKNNAIINSLKLIYDFANSSLPKNFEDIAIQCYSDDYIKEKLKPSYEKIVAKYSSEEIDPYIFMQILYNTKRIEYCNGMVDDLDILEIRDITIGKYASLYMKELQKQKLSYRGIDLLFKRMKYEMTLENNLNSTNNESIEKDVTNMKLIRVLKEIQK